MTSRQMSQQSYGFLKEGIKWAHAVVRQVERLHAAERRLQESAEVRITHYSPRDRIPFDELSADRDFLALAVAQLIKCLRLLGEPGFAGPPTLMNGVTYTEFRNALEHWEETRLGWGPQRFKARAGEDKEPTDYSWGGTGSIMARLIEVDDMSAWAASTCEALIALETRTVID